MYGQLIPCGGGNPLPLLKSRLIVGRKPECDVTVAHGTVSSKHCLLEIRNGAWFATDMGSRNGIRIDGVRCQEGGLAPGSVLSIAQIRYQIDYVLKGKTAAVPPPVAAPRLRESDTTLVETPRPAADAARPAPKPPGAVLGEMIPCGGGAPIALTKARLIVGRHPMCDIMLAFPLVSAKHCQLEFKEGYWHVRDLGSRNGIRVDGIVQLAKYVRPGEILSIAKYRYEIAYTPLADEPPPEENPFALSLMEKAGLVGRGRGAAAEFPRAPDDDAPRKKWSIGGTDVK
jgi:adenylate cyclase